MNYVKQFFVNVKANPKTTAAAVAGVIGCAVGAIHEPAKMATAEWWALLFVSAGLLIAADQQPA